jgi:hypothetical protein
MAQDPDAKFEMFSSRSAGNSVRGGFERNFSHQPLAMERAMTPITTILTARAALAAALALGSLAEPGTLMGPGFRTLRTIGNVGKDVLYSDRRITRQTVRNVANLLPYTGTFYLRGVTNAAVDSIAYGFGLPKQQPRR